MPRVNLKGEPNLNFELLQEIRDKAEIPLVLHGGSGISKENFKKAISLGIRKINFYTQNLDCQKALEEYRQVNPLSAGKDMTRIWNIITEVHYSNAMYNIKDWGSAGQA